MPTTSAAGRILVADDSLVVRTVVCDQLEDEGYEVAQAVDGASALAQCAGFRPDAILLDIEMPGLDGHQVLPVVEAALQNEALVIRLFLPPSARQAIQHARFAQ